MKTKPFLLATAGSTVDGRNIDDKMLEEMASSYDPKTYGARLNIEHIRGISGEGPFRAYGDILELSVSDVTVNFNGKAETRKGLFGVFDVTDDAKKLNSAKQKVFPSIEIEPNFAGKGFAYLMGCALTDSPAAIATDRLQFNRQLPGMLSVAGEDAALLEFADDAGPEGGKALLTSIKAMFDSFTAKFAADPKPEDKPGETPPAASPNDFSQLRPLLEEMGTTFAAAIETARSEFRAEADRLALRFKKLETEADPDPAPNFRRRPQADGNANNYSGIF